MHVCESFIAFSIVVCDAVWLFEVMMGRKCSRCTCKQRKTHKYPQRATESAFSGRLLCAHHLIAVVVAFTLAVVAASCALAHSIARFMSLKLLCALLCMNMCESAQLVWKVSKWQHTHTPTHGIVLFFFRCVIHVSPYFGFVYTQFYL